MKKCTMNGRSHVRVKMGVQGEEAGSGGRKRENIVLEQDIRKRRSHIIRYVYFYKPEDWSVEENCIVHYQLY